MERVVEMLVVAVVVVVVVVVVCEEYRYILIYIESSNIEFNY